MARFSNSLRDVPPPEQMVQFPPDFGQRFILTVDTEEEFDWSAPFQAEGYRTDSVRALPKFQAFCEERGISPIYMIDYPIAANEEAAAMLGGFCRAGKAEVGIQLHPWVNPPHEEEVNSRNSYAGNLPPALEAAKFNALVAAIRENLQVEPRIYRAGRYGVGQDTAQILIDAGVRIDSSVRSKFNYSAYHGPNFAKFPLRPYWVDRAAGLIELPPTTVFSGALRSASSWLFPLSQKIPKLPGVLARLGLLERISLTPEGITVKEGLRGAQVAVADALPVINLSFHSPSLEPGNTPYVRSEEDLENLYHWLGSVTDYLQAAGVKPATTGDILDAVGT